MHVAVMVCISVVSVCVYVSVYVCICVSMSFCSMSVSVFMLVHICGFVCWFMCCICVRTCSLSSSVCVYVVSLLFDGGCTVVVSCVVCGFDVFVVLPHSLNSCVDWTSFWWLWHLRLKQMLGLTVADFVVIWMGCVHVLFCVWFPYVLASAWVMC